MSIAESAEPAIATGAALSERVTHARGRLKELAVRAVAAVFHRPERPSRAELSARLERCEEILGALGIEEGFLVARGFLVRDSEGRGRFAVRAMDDGSTRLDLWHEPGKAGLSLRVQEGNAMLLLRDSRGQVRVGAGVNDEAASVGVHDPEGAVRAGFYVEGFEPTLQLVHRVEVESESPAEVSLGGYL